MLREARRAGNGAHYIVVYPDLTTLREIYSPYIKTALYERNEIVIILPFFETVDTVRRVLTEKHMDVRKYEREQSLIILDALKGYFGSPEGIMPFIKQIIEYAKTSGKNGVSVFGDVGPFFYYHKENGVIDFELSLPSEYDIKLNLKTFCLYHKRDFDSRLTEEQREKLLEHHVKNLIVLPTIR